MKIYRLLPILFLIGLRTWACGGGYYSENWFFYSIFNQDMISDTSYSPFLYTEETRFYNQEKKSKIPQGNLKLWKKVLPRWSTKDLMTLIYGNDEKVANALWQSKAKKKASNIKDYIDFARKNTGKSPISYGGKWEYSNHLKSSKTFDYSAEIEYAIQKFRTEKHKEIKQRYGYQIIRLLRKNKDYEGAIFFFENQDLDRFTHNEIYYYTLDQLAGCYYRLNQSDKAIALFSKVFAFSRDKKESALISYNFCLNRTKAKFNFGSKEEELSFYLIQSFSDFNNGVEILNKMKAIDPNDARLEVVMARNLSEVDRYIWDKSPLGVLNITERADKINGLKAFSKSLRNSKQTDFWQYCYAYLTGLSGDYTGAILELEKIKDHRFNLEKKELTFLFSALQWKTPDQINQQYFNNNFDITIGDCDGARPHAIHHFIKDYLGNIFVEHNQRAQAYLMHNSLDEGRLSSLEMADDLLTFIDKKGKNNIERLLFKSIPKNAVDKINHDKGILFLFEGSFDKAASTFPKSLEYKSITRLVFSNTLKTCFECDAHKMMTDSVYLASPFAFIKEETTHIELAENLIKLKTLADEDKSWKGQLANYLIANFFNNISNTGYFRGLLWGGGNCCNYDYVNPVSYNEASTTNLEYYNENPETYFGTALLANNYYSKLIESSKNIELKARCTFLIAQCELNAIDNSSDRYYGNELIKYTSDGNVYYFDKYPSYSESFKTLSTDYKNTNFYKEVIKECSYFRMYCQ